MTTSTQTLLSKSDRTKYVDGEVVKSALKGGDIKDLTFFKLDRYITDDELEKEYESRGLTPATLDALLEYDQTEKGREDLDSKQYSATHWKDGAGDWFFATFTRWGGDGRGVGVSRSVGDWSGYWWFAGLRKIGTQVLGTQPSSTLEPWLLKKLQSIEKIIEEIKNHKNENAR